MKSFTFAFAPLACVMLLVSSALAQQGPPPGPPDGGGDGGGQGGPPAMRDGNQRGGGGPGRMGPGGGGGMGGPMRDGMPGMGGGNGPMGGPWNQIQMLRGYMDLVDSMSRLAKDPDAAGVAAVISGAEVLKPRGPDAAIDYFNKLLPDARSQTIQRAIRLQLIDLYKASGQQEKALEQVRQLTTGAAPASGG